MSVYIISDLHFSHKNILEYESMRLELVCEYMKKKLNTNKPIEYLIENYHKAVAENDLKTIEEYLDYHNKWLIRNWNNTVKSEDTVYMLGDFTLTRSMDKIIEFTNKLQGHKHLVMGNHDTRKPADYIKAGWESASPKSILIPFSYDKNIILSHRPPVDIKLVDYEVAEETLRANPIHWSNDYFYLFGHVHGKVSSVEAHSNVACCCVERFSGIPKRLEDIIKDLKKEEA